MGILSKMNNCKISISVKHNNTELKYEQTTDNCSVFAAVTKKGYSSTGSQEMLMLTIKEMCAEVRTLSDGYKCTGLADN